MDDQELDDLFRKAVKEPDIQFVPDDWKKMQEKLDGKGKGVATKNSSKYLYGIGVLLFLFAVSWVLIAVDFTGEYKPLDSNNRREVATETNDLPNPSREKTGATVQTSDLPITSNLPQKGIETAKGLSPESNTFSETGSPHPGMGAGKINDFAAYEKQELLENSALGNNNFTQSETIENHVILEKVRKPELSTLSVRENSWLIDSGMKRNTMATKSSIDSQTFPEEIVKTSGRKIKGQSKLAVSVVFSPDASALKINEIQGLGANAGLNLEYFIHANWSLNLGVLYAFKTYQSPSGYQGSYGNVYDLSGNCYILDIPLNVRYYAINGDRDRWYASTGLSSYLMLREKYDLSYESSTGYPKELQLDIKNQNQHYFSIVNLSVGYERHLSDNLGIQVEPYLKIPYSGVGEGDVNLKSAGVLIGLKYRW